MTLPLPFRRPLALLLVLGLAAAQHALAALPPSAYKPDQDAAPEALVIAVLSVKSEVNKDRESTRTHVEARARVVEVKRTASGLKVGDEIAISYTNLELKRDERRVGPGSYIPVLEEGKVVPAYVKGNQKTGYMPAAQIYSFQEIR